MSCDILGPLRIAEDDEVMRVNANQTKESKERKKDDVVVGVWIDSVGWRCSVNVFVFRRRYCSHRKHKFIVWPTMASNWLEVVQNYNYITRATKKKKKPQVLTKYGEKEEEEGKKNQHVSICGRCIHQAFCTVLYVPRTTLKRSHAVMLQCVHRHTTSSNDLHLQTVTLFFAFRTVRNSEFMFCSMLGLRRLRR